MQARRKTIDTEFIYRYGKEPTLWTRAPGRVDLMGSHTDYNMGYVMTMTIDRDTWIAAAPRDDGTVQVQSVDLAGSSEFSFNNLSRDEDLPWANYVRGVAKFCMEAGHKLKGFDALIHSTVPFGAGLSSSAALEMAAGMMFQLTGGFRLDPVEMALIGQKAENNFVGVNTGILDQFSSAMGEAGKTILLDCRALTSEMVTMPTDLHVMICDTKAKRNLVGSEYDDRRSQCEEGVDILQRHFPEINSLRDTSCEQFNSVKGEMPEVVQRRCQFILDENQRVLDLEKPLSVNDKDALRKLFNESYFGARDLYGIGAPAMEAMYQAMMNAPGVVAARQTGAGFGGCMVALVEPDKVEEFSAAVIADYDQRMGLKAEIYSVEASQGASMIKF